MNSSRIKNQTLIPFLCPASKPSEPDYFEEHQFMTNWYTVQHEGWHLPGTKDEHDWCGLWQTRGCLNVEGHKHSEHKNQIYVKQYQRSCYRPDCKKCFRKWIARQANRSTRRIEKFQKQSGMKSKHILLSVSEWDYGKPIEELRKKAYSILKSVHCIGGTFIFHPFRFNKKLRLYYYSPHFHIVGFGIIIGIAESFRKNGWFVKDLGIRESVFQSFYYLLSHCGIKKGFHALTWFGDLSYSKLKIEKEPDSSICPVCNQKLVLIYHDGIHPVAPPDQIFEGFVDPFDWYEVETMPKSEWTKKDRYEYALTKELYESNKGISLAL